MKYAIEDKSYNINTLEIEHGKGDVVRINKYLSKIGFCSRREADRYIEAQRVLVNGELALTGLKVNYKDEIMVDGKVINIKNKLVYIVLNKPKGITSTTDIAIEGNLTTFMNYPNRIFMIGRLDKDSQGLLLLSNDGDIVNKVLRSGNNHEKEYVVTVNKPITDTFMNNMASGVNILDQMTKPCKVSKIDGFSFRITLVQGLNRQIRRMCNAFDYQVVDLKRVRIMNIKIDKLKIGHWRYLSDKEIKTLNDDIINSTN